MKRIISICFIVFILVALISCGGGVENSSAVQAASKAFQIDGLNESFDTLQNAIFALQSLASFKGLYTIRLTRDVTDPGALIDYISDNIRIDLQGHTITLPENGYGLLIHNDKGVEIANGSVKMPSGSLDGRTAIITSISDLILNDVEINALGSHVNAVETSQGTVNICGSSIITTSDNKNTIEAKGTAYVQITSSDVLLLGGLVLTGNSCVDIGESKLFLTKDIEKGADCYFSAKEENLFPQNDNVNMEMNSILIDANHVHSWDDGVIIQELSESLPEIIRYTCLDCGIKWEKETFNVKVEFVLDNGQNNIVYYSLSDVSITPPDAHRWGYNLIGWKRYRFSNKSLIPYSNGEAYHYDVYSNTIDVSGSSQNYYVRSEAVWDAIDISAFNNCPVYGTWYNKLDYGKTYTFNSDGSLIICSDASEIKVLHWQPNGNCWKSNVVSSYYSSILIGDGDDAEVYYCKRQYGDLFISDSILFDSCFVIECQNSENLKYPGQNSKYTLFDGCLSVIDSIDNITGVLEGNFYTSFEYVEYDLLKSFNENTNSSPVFGIEYVLNNEKYIVGISENETYGPSSDSKVYLWTSDNDSELYYCKSLVFSEDDMIQYSEPIVLGSLHSAGLTAKSYKSGIWSEPISLNVCLDPKLSLDESFEPAINVGRIVSGSFFVSFPEQYNDTFIELYDLGPEDISIYYTIDDSDPATSSTRKKYTERINFFEETARNPLVVIKVLALSADNNPVGSATYMVWKKGPAGGFIVYDKGNYDDGWRYVEFYPYSIGDYIFGFGKDSLGNVIEFETEDGLGKGLLNTEKIISKIGDEAFCSAEFYDTETTVKYAAKVCDSLVLNEFDDWVLPSAGDVFVFKWHYKKLYKLESATALGSSLTSTRYTHCICFAKYSYNSVSSWYFYDENHISADIKAAVCPARYF